MGVSEYVTVTVRLRLVPPDDAKAEPGELSEAVELACAGIGGMIGFDVAAQRSEDGVEVWVVDEATVIDA